MRKIPLFAFILISASLLSGSYHQTSAIGLDSSSHGLLYGGRVVRRYGNLGNGKNLFNKRYPKGLQARAVDPSANDPKNPPAKNNPTAPAPNAPNAAPSASTAPKPTVVPKQPAKVAPKEDTKQPQPQPKTKATPTPNPPNQQSPDESDTTTPNTSSDQAVSTDSSTGAGTPTVATGNISTPALVGLASIGGVFVLVAGLFAFGQRRKNKEMTKSIVSTSAKAWEQQNSTYEKMEEEAEPIGSYPVIATYTPTLADELDIQPGDNVTILVEFDDGWVQGINETRGGAKGVFPRHCVDMDQAVSNKNIKRSSSMGVYSEKYTEVDLS